jgi:hypothetical protein
VVLFACAEGANAAAFAMLRPQQLVRFCVAGRRTLPCMIATRGAVFID